MQCTGDGGGGQHLEVGLLTSLALDPGEHQEANFSLGGKNQSQPQIL